jgi:acyl transferase domain-containing protein
MAGRFPGAADVDQFWLNLVGGVESVRFLDDDELLASGVSAATLADPHYVRALCAPDELAGFDAGLFGLSSREARIADPQIRIFLEAVHAAIENSGYDVSRLPDVAVFGSAGPNRYLELVLHSEDIDPSSPAAALVRSWNLADHLTTVVSHRLGFRGPNLAGLAGGSGSLVAVHLAAAALLAGQCRVALAGGVEVGVPLGHGYLWEPGRSSSPDGHTRPFDHHSDGAVPGAGVGVVVLKRLSDAIADRDHIRAVIRATAVNTGGADRAGRTAPSASGQHSACAEAMSLAGLTGRDLSLVEAQARGSQLGEPIEPIEPIESIEPTEPIEPIGAGGASGAGGAIGAGGASGVIEAIEVAALTAAFASTGAGDPEACALTSVKGNIGDLRHAAGIASLIKVALALENGVIPGNIGMREPHPALALQGSPFYLPAEAVAWPRQAERPRFAAVNTVGVDGTNAHVILGEAPAATPIRTSPATNGGEPAGDSVAPTAVRPRIVVWSAATHTAAKRYQDRLATHFATPGAAAFAAAASTLQRGRTALPFRGAVVATSAAEAASRLTEPVEVTAPRESLGQIGFLFPGAASVAAGVAADLYEHSGAYAGTFDECLAQFEAHGVPLRRLWREGDPTERSAPPTTDAVVFSVEYSLARAWQAWGVTPALVVGHGLGELTAACVAGVFTLADAVRAVVARAEALAQIPMTAVLTVAGGIAAVTPHLVDGVHLCAVNSPTQVMLTGPADRLGEVAATLRAAGLASRPGTSTQATYSRISAPAVEAFTRTLELVTPAAASIRLYSGVTGREVGAEEAGDRGFWAAALAQPVNFSGMLDSLVTSADSHLLIEVGPGRALTAVVRQHPSVAAGFTQVLPTLTQRRTDPVSEVRSALAAVASVWVSGHDVNWAAVEDLAEFNRVPVPGYPYERTPHWYDSSIVVAAPAASGAATTPAGAATTAERLRELWVALLGRSEIAANADFFDLGGNSLTAVELMSRIRVTFGRDLGLITLFDHPTLDALAAQIDRRAP